MPIKFWLLGESKGEKIVPVDDLGTFANLYPPKFLQHLVDHEADDHWHSGDRLTVTGGLGCPRATFIQRAMPYVCDPAKKVSVTLGTALHEWLEHMVPDDWCIERTYMGKLFGLDVGCRVDAHAPDWSEMWDWKTSMNGAHVFAKDVAKPEHSAQLNMCRLIASQVVGRALEPKMVVWTVSGGFAHSIAPLMSEAECGDVKPGGSKFTVRDTLHALAKAHGIHAATGDVGAALATLPFAGETMYVNKKGGSMCTALCPCAKTCYGAVGSL